MSKDYIEINKNTFPTPFSKRLNGYMQGWNDCLDSVLQHKAADVAPVVHGEWIKGEENSHRRIIECSHCKTGFVLDNSETNPNYCPNCGARMDGGNK